MSIVNGCVSEKTRLLSKHYDFDYNKDLTELEQLKKRFKDNQKVLRTQPARKDLFLENHTLSKRMKELKMQEKTRKVS